MRSRFFGYAIAITVGVTVSALAQAEPKGRNKGGPPAVGDKSIEQQSEWEKKVLGDDSAKAADMKKIAAAQKLADAAAKNPPPVQAPKPKDPNKEGVRAKQEAAIGLPIASDQETRPTKKNTSKKSAENPSSANDALGALVASSLAEEKAAETGNSRKGVSTAGGKSKGKAAAAAPASSLDQMFATSGQ